MTGLLRSRALGARAFGALLALAAFGCGSSDSGYQAGALGNGGYYFSCDDAVSCKRYSDDASKFPKAVSLGSTFAVRFVPQTSQTGINFNESAPNRGITVSPIADFVTVGPSGLTAVKAGYATLASRDASGQLVDYTVLRVARPDALIVYDDNDANTTSPTPLDSVTLSMSVSDNASKVLHAFAQEKKQVLAGSLQLEWTSSNSAVVSVDSTTSGKATIVARSAGSATITATGGTFTRDVPVTVQP